ncbi:MinD/ParA family ATP-binding protein [Kribbella antibiotica]|nr:AAA family ATPase [Kribbella antibiotica]
MWQPTPSWTQPDEPATDEETQTAEETPDALSEEFPGDSWSRPAAQSVPGQPAPWEKQTPAVSPTPEPQPTPAPAKPSTPSWTQPAAESGASWTQPVAEKPDFDDESVDDVKATDEVAPTVHGSHAAPTADVPAAPAHDSGPAGAPEPVPTPVFGGQSFSVSPPPFGQAAPSTPPAQAPQQGGQPLSPAAQHFFPQGVPGQNVPQQQREVSYRTDELMQALPLPREAPAERGVRSVLRLRPGTSERSDRIARATAATAFRRPVTIVVANPKGGSGKTPTTLLLAGALGQARGGGVVAWDNNELRGNMHLRTHDTNARSTVTDMLQAMAMLTQPDARLGDVAAYLRHQVSGQYDVLTSATTTYAQIEAKDFDQIHRLLSRFYKVLVIDTGNNEGSSNWREAMKAADALVIPIKWKSLSCAAAVQMLEELDNQGPEAQRLIRRAIIAVSNGPGDINREVEKQLRPYFESRAAAVVDIPTDQHIAAEGALDHSALQPATRRAGLELAARVSEQISIALNVPR